MNKFITYADQLSFNPYLSVSTVKFEVSNFEIGLFQEYAVKIDRKLVRSVDKRKAEYLAGRICAQKALRHLIGTSREPLIIPVGEHREPVWPDNILGSITHSHNCAICAVGDKQVFKYIGFDVEETMSSEQASELANQIHSDLEQQLLIKSGMSEQLATTVLFSAKESIFKGLYYQVRKYFGFEVARLVEVDAHLRRLKFRLNIRFSLKYKLPEEVTCQFMYYDHLILTNMIVEW